MINVNEIDKNIAYDPKKRWKYANITKDTIAFIDVFNDFILTNPLAKDTVSSVDDFIVSLRTHLLMISYSSKKINNYISQVVIPNLKKLINEKIKNYNK
jgi:hypothetical protein